MMNRPMRRPVLPLVLLLLAVLVILSIGASCARVTGQAAKHPPAPTVTPAPSPTPLPTVAPAAGRPPRLMRRSPAQRQLDQLRPTIWLTFDRPMDPVSVAAALSVSPSLPLDLHWDDDVLRVRPQQNLEPGRRYLFALGRAATDTAGVPLARAERWEYRLQEVLGQSTWPNRDRPDAPIVLHFNYPVDTRSVERALTVDPAIPGQWQWNEAGTTISLQPATRLSSSTVYTVHFTSALRTADGDPLPMPDPLRFTTPPPILAVQPAAGRVALASDAVRVTFDRPMDAASVETAFAISPRVGGSFTWQGTTLTFRPYSGYLQEYSAYTVTIGAGALDLDGTPVLARDYRWSFQTDAVPHLADFGTGPNAQVLDADGRRALQFSVFQAEPILLTFELYALSPEQFLSRYASGFRGVAGWEDAPISLGGTTLARRWQVETAQGTARYRNVQETVVPADVPPGLYVLNLQAGHLDDQLILILTRHVLTLKQAGGQIVAWVSDVNGAAAAGVEVGVYARDGQLLAQGTTDGNGVYRAQVGRNPQPLIVLARAGDDVTAAGLSNEWLSSRARWWGWWRPTPVTPDYAAHIYTDRPIYRPGQTVYFKAIVRRDDDALLSPLPEGTPVTLRIRDARNNVVRTLWRATNAFGSVDGRFDLAEGAVLGTYAVELLLDGESHRRTFEVQDYRKPDYRVLVSTDAARYVAGDPIRVAVDSRYFFGEPVANARLSLKLYELGEPYCYWWDDCQADELVWYQSGHPAVEAHTDANGYFTYTLEASLAQSHTGYTGVAPSSSRWGIEVSVDDGSHQTVSNFAAVTVYPAGELIDLDTGGCLQVPGQPFTVRAGVNTIDGAPVAGRALRLEVRRYSWHSGDHTHVAHRAELTSGPDGRASTSFAVNRSGFYEVRVSGSDARGNATSATRWLYIFDAAGAWVSERNQLAITADRERYAPGETARLVIESPFSGPALLTFERGTTRREQLVELTAPLSVVDVPIQADDAPNIFVTVVAWEAQDTTLGEDVYHSLSDSQLHAASVELQVPVTGRTLDVRITPDRAQYAPRQRANFSVRVTDAAGQPVQAELSLALVDEAVFSLSRQPEGAMYDDFYGPREHAVRTYDGLSLLRYLPSLDRGGGGDAGTAGNPRSDFPDTAVWRPSLTTDANGEALLSLTLPDSLTSWRLTVKAVTAADTQVGEAFVNVVTHQEIVVRPILPRGLTAGDRAQVSVFVHNYGDAARCVRVSLVTGGTGTLNVHGPITRSVDLAPGEVRAVGWWVAALAHGEVEVTARAVADRAGDAVRLALPIRPLAIPDVQTQVGEFSGAWQTELELSEGGLDTSQVEIRLTRSVAGGLLAGLEYLTGYPYGCVEQTMSRALPNAVVARAFRRLGVGHPALEADLPAMINAGVQRLYGFQHSDGAWGWWYDDSSDDYQTAWVVFGLSVTADAGYQVDPEVVRRGANWLAERLPEMDVRTRAYALYSLSAAGRGNLEAARDLAADLEELDTFSRAALALALHELGAADEARAIVDGLAESAVVDEDGVHWTSPTGDGHYYSKTMASSTRSTALALSAFVRICPNHPLEPGIVRWLMSQRRQDGWGTTNETAYTVLALTDHLLAAEQVAHDAVYSVELNGQIVESGVLGRGAPIAQLTLTAGQLRPGRNVLRLLADGDAPLYYAVTQRAYLRQAQIAGAGRVRVVREYLNPTTGRPITGAVAGRLVMVRLKVTLPAGSCYILVEDHLPGGLEALNEGLSTTSHQASPYEVLHYYWQDYGYNYKEIRGDRVDFFITEMSNSMHTFTYLARATHAGEFVALPAEVGAMYDLSVWGRSASSTLTVTGE